LNTSKESEQAKVVRDLSANSPAGYHSPRQTPVSNNVGYR